MEGVEGFWAPLPDVAARVLWNRGGAGPAPFACVGAGATGALPAGSGLAPSPRGPLEFGALGALPLPLFPARGAGNAAEETVSESIGGLARPLAGSPPGARALAGLSAGPSPSAAGASLLGLGLFKFPRLPAPSGVGSAEAPNPSWRPHHLSLEASGTVWVEDAAAPARFAASSLTCCLAASLLDSCSAACCRARSSISCGGACRGRPRGACRGALAVCLPGDGWGTGMGFPRAGASRGRGRAP